nr:hypothetical protein Iba_chr02eCG6630 [Ipomoea batatas]
MLRSPVSSAAASHPGVEVSLDAPALDSSRTITTVSARAARLRARQSRRGQPRFPAIDLSAISDINNSFTFARNSDAISTFGIIGFIFSAMSPSSPNSPALHWRIPNSPALRWRSSSTKAAFLLQPQGWRRKVATDCRFQTGRLADDDTRQHC